MLCSAREVEEMPLTLCLSPSLKSSMLPGAGAGGAGGYVVSLAACHLVRAINFLNDYSEALNRASVYKRVRLK